MSETMTVEPTLHPIGPVLGTEVRGIDLARDTDQATADWIKQTLAEKAVLVFRDQQMKAQDIAALGRRLGTITPHIFPEYRHPEVPEVSFVTNRDAEGNIDRFGVTRASKWHFDESYKEHLPRLTMLHALQVPKVKGGTEFVDMRSAHDAKPDALREKVEGLVSVFRPGKGGEAHHPTVYTHPVTGRRLLLISPQHQVGFEGMENEDGIALMYEIQDHATQPQFYYYHQWQVGDVVMWDQISTMHRNAVDSDPREPRIFLRTIVH
jgi:alpha-ketoglutarate-dependent taurine dioxygenase